MNVHELDFIEHRWENLLFFIDISERSRELVNLFQTSTKGNITQI